MNRDHKKVVLYDTGALIAAERAETRMSAYHERLKRSKHKPLVPAVVLAQAWRERNHPLLSRLLKGCVIIPDTEAIARKAGVACGIAGTSDVVDAIVVATAAAQQQEVVVVTSDPKDLECLAEALGVHGTKVQTRKV